MSSYNEGYDKGYEDALGGNSNMYNYITGSGSDIMDTIIPVLEGEEDWKKGYQDGWEAGDAEE